MISAFNTSVIFCIQRWKNLADHVIRLESVYLSIKTQILNEKQFNWRLSPMKFKTGLSKCYFSGVYNLLIRIVYHAMIWIFFEGTFDLPLKPIHNAMLYQSLLEKSPSAQPASSAKKLKFSLPQTSISQPKLCVYLNFGTWLNQKDCVIKEIIKVLNVCFCLILYFKKNLFRKICLLNITNTVDRQKYNIHEYVLTQLLK